MYVSSNQIIKILPDIDQVSLLPERTIPDNLDNIQPIAGVS
jgi:hypothetical protein